MSLTSFAMTRRAITLILPAFLFFACEEWNYPEVDDFPAFTTTVVEEGISAAMVETQLLHFDGLTIESYGYCWSQGVLPTLEDQCVNFEGAPTFDRFSNSFDQLALNQLYFIRPYVTLSSPVQRTLYGEAVQVLTGEIVLSTGEFTQTFSNTSARVFGFVGGLDSTTVIEQHGHIWSATPDIQSLADGNFSNLGPFTGNGSFSTEIRDLQSLEKYYVRSYVILDGVLFLGNAESFHLGGWEHVSTAPPAMTTRGLPMTFSIGKKLYVGGGFKVSTEDQLVRVLIFQQYEEIEVFNDFWECDLETGKWRPIAPFPGRQRISASCFTINGQGYVGWGLNENNGVERSFHRYDPASNTWTTFSSPADIQPRYGAIAFVMGDGAVYLGAGSTPTLGLTDFYRFTPANNQWEPKADFGGGPRRNAVSFTIGDYGYAGLGDNLLESDIFINFDAVDDFWRYEPEADRWVLLGRFPGGPRNFVGGGSLNGKGYLGFGIEGFNVYYSDIWSFDPNNNRWRKLENFQEGRRGFVFGTATQSGLYFGFGIREPLEALDWERDIWQYIIIE